MSHVEKCAVCNKDFHTRQEAHDHNCGAVLNGSTVLGNTGVIVVPMGYSSGPMGHTAVPATAKAAKNDQAKPDLSLIPGIALVECAKAFMVGEKKYGRYNYCKGHTAAQIISAIQRHASQFNDGENIDADGQHHLGAIMASCAMALRQIELNTFIDNRYKKDEK